LIEQEVANAELIAKKAKEDLQKAKERLAEKADANTPQTEGFEHDKSLSTTSSISIICSTPRGSRLPRCYSTSYGDGGAC
jgi:hypothetical protein